MLEFAILGTLAVRRDGEEVSIPGSRRRALLLRLLVNPNETVPVDLLIEDVWDGTPPPAAPRTLQSHISYLRKTLGQERLFRSAAGYGITCGDEELDAIQVASARNLGKQAFVARDFQTADLILGSALKRWRGEALTDVNTYSWARSTITHLDEMKVAITEMWLDSLLALGRHLDVVSYSENAVAIYSFNERFWAQLMTSLYRSGRRADALNAYQRLRRELDEELGLEPSADLVSLEEAVLLRKPELEWHEDSYIQPASTGLRPTTTSGTVNLLVTGIEASARLWEEYPEEMAVAVRCHDDLLCLAIEDHMGCIFKQVSDSFYAVFPTASGAAQAAVAAQRTLSAAEPMPSPVELRVRIALHTGHCEERDGEYFGTAVDRLARLEAIAHGGQIIVSSTTAEILDEGPEQIPLCDLGEHRLKDLSRPEHVFQILAPGLQSDFPPLRSLDNPSLDNNLPAQLTSFVGRQREMAEVAELIASHRLVTITGAGGAGKTRLALAVAAEVCDGSGGGAWFVDLAPLSDPQFVPSEVATALRLRDNPSRPIVDHLIEVLGKRRLLIVLDNCEHLIDACIRLIDRVLRSCPGVHLLATSRFALGMGGEQLYRIPPLSLSDESSHDPASSEALSLFVERARDHHPDFVLDDTNLEAVVETCRRLDAMPLAIELACAQLRSMSLRDVAARLDQRFRLLNRGSRSALPRQQALQALIDWSYDLLSEPERIVFENLSVFAGGFDLAGAEAIAATDEIDSFQVDEIIGSLVDKSFVQHEYSAVSLHYGLQETIRHYGDERLISRSGHARNRARKAHATHFLRLAEEAKPHLRGPDQVDWLDRLEVEHDNFEVGHRDARRDVSPAGGLVLGGGTLSILVHSTSKRRALNAGGATGSSASQ